MPFRDPTAIGRVRHVLGSTVTVELDPTLAGVTPLWRGRPVPIGQVGSLVRLPQGPVTLLASVTLVGISELTAPQPPALTPEQGDRWLQVQLLGEVDALGKFRRGVATYPGLDDTVHFVTAEDIAAAYPPPNEHRVKVGVVSSNPDVPVAVDLASFVARHSAIVGSTGSGKSSTVASILQSVVDQGWTSANLVVIDPHGEYASAFGATASVRSVFGDGANALRVPFWALPPSDLLHLLTGIETKTVLDRFTELVVEDRIRFASECQWIPDELTIGIGAETPLPYDLRNVWYALDRANRRTVEGNQASPEALVAEGDPATLTPAEFEPYGAGGAPPNKGVTFGSYSPAVDRLRARLTDPTYGFLLDPPDPIAADPLPGTVAEWLGGTSPISILDFSGVPSEVADVAIGVTLQILLEVSTRSEVGDGIGRGRPTLVVLEEAHRYLADTRTTGRARVSVNRIAREGRKYGIGMCLVTQRPSELPDTALSQCGTIVALRLTNATDQTTVRSALPDSVSGLAAILPSLRTGEALISGEAIALPTRAAIRRPAPEPHAADPELDGWLVDPKVMPDVSGAIGRWREGN
jgi:uncharacterized protein